MSNMFKNFTCNSDSKLLHKDILNWCNLNEVDIETSNGDDNSFFISGNKICRSNVTFSWASVAGWLFFGILMVAMGERNDPNAKVIIWIPVIIYVISYFIRKRDKTINLKIKSISKDSKIASVTISIDKTNPQLNSDINQFFAKYI